MNLEVKEAMIPNLLRQELGIMYNFKETNIITQYPNLPLKLLLPGRQLLRLTPIITIIDAKLLPIRQHLHLPIILFHPLQQIAHHQLIKILITVTNSS